VFPFNFASNSVMRAEDGIILRANSFSGPIPEIPPQTSTVQLQGNAWSGDLPTSWHNAPNLTVLDLHDL
jgi:hypothetical protein